MPKAGPGKKLCGAKTPRGKAPTCENVAGKGTDHLGYGHCSRHGGNTKTHRKAAATEQAEAAVAYYGLPREIDPHHALIEELYRTAGHVAWLERVIHAGHLGKADNPTGRRRTVKLDQPTMGGDIPSVWLDLYERERKHLRDVAKTCISLGIEERKVKIAEQQGELFAEAIKGILTELGVIDRPEVPTVVRRHLTLVAAS